jgi:hypothetical protein
LEGRAGRQGLRQLRVDHQIADAERREPIGRLAQHQRLKHLPRLQHDRLGRRGETRDGKLGQRLDGSDHPATLPDSG